MLKGLRAVLLLFVVLSTSCNKIDDLIENTFNSEDILNVSYGANASNVMDVYLPAGRNENTKAVILIHGGSWISGDKSEFSDYAAAFRRRGFAVINLNYRLVNSAGTVRLAEQQNDIKAAVDLVYSKASEWRISNKIGLLGASAGAHLALLYCYHNNVEGKVKTVVSLAGPANLTDARNVNPQLVPIVEGLLGASVSSNLQLYKDASPIYNVNASSKPTLIFHGRKDVIVPVQQSIDLKAKLDEVNVKNKLVIYETTGHEVLSMENTASFMSEVENWFKENIN